MIKFLSTENEKIFLYPSKGLPILSLHLPFNGILNDFLFNRNFITILRNIKEINEDIANTKSKDLIKSNHILTLNSTLHQKSTILDTLLLKVNETDTKIIQLKSQIDCLKVISRDKEVESDQDDDDGSGIEEPLVKNVQKAFSPNLQMLNSKQLFLF